MRNRVSSIILEIVSYPFSENIIHIKKINIKITVFPIKIGINSPLLDLALNKNVYWKNILYASIIVGLEYVFISLIKKGVHHSLCSPYHRVTAK